MIQLICRQCGKTQQIVLVSYLCVEYRRCPQCGRTFDWQHSQTIIRD